MSPLSGGEGFCPEAHQVHFCDDFSRAARPLSLGHPSYPTAHALWWPSVQALLLRS